jgi:hypothetical protein
MKPWVERKVGEGRKEKERKREREREVEKGGREGGKKEMKPEHRKILKDFIVNSEEHTKCLKY